MKNVLATLFEFDPVQVRLTQRLHTPRSYRILGLAHRLMAALRRSHQRRVAIRALEQLSDWQLKDIGVSRDDIRTIVDQQLKADRSLPTRTTAPRPSIGSVGQTAKGATNDHQSRIAA